MAIEVGLTIGGEKTTLTTNYAFYSVSGVTSSGSNFVLNLETDRWYVLDDSSGEYVAYGATSVSPFDNLPPSFYTQEFYGGVKNLLDSTAISYGYDSIDNAVSYYNSLDPTKREEARSFSDWRDSVLSLADTNIYGFTADGITLPDLAGFTGQTGYIDYEVFPIPTTFFGDEDAGYHITDLENRIFTAWINIDHDSTSNYGYGVQIPFPTGNITDVYSIGALVDQGGLTSEWFSDDYTLKIKFSGTANSYGVLTEFDYKINSLNNTSSYQGLKLRFNILGGY